MSEHLQARLKFLRVKLQAQEEKVQSDQRDKHAKKCVERTKQEIEDIEKVIQ